MSQAVAPCRYFARFDSLRTPMLTTDVLILGGGVAGLRAALSAAERCDVVVLAKGTLRDSATAYAQGGVAAAIGPGDRLEDHARDTLAVGCGLCDEPAVRLVVEQGPAAIAELISWGAKFDKVGAALALGREGGHGAARIAHAWGDATGAEIVHALLHRARGHRRIRLIERCFAIDLVTHEGVVVGVVAFQPRHGLVLIAAPTTILATGGAGCIYRETTNPALATGDGLAMAFRAGATLCDLEMVQFHPTALYVAGAKRALISEAVRGEGAYLIDQSGSRFMHEFDERGELAPRDIVSRAIMRRMRREGSPCAYLDARHFPPGRFAQRFPGITRLLGDSGLDPEKDLIPVRPAAHYMVGGVLADLDTRTTLPGLLACGEVASSGLHGANRLASNSLLEGLVFGRRAGEIAARGRGAGPRAGSKLPLQYEAAPPSRTALDLDDLRNNVRSLMDRDLGLERNDAGLRAALGQLESWAAHALSTASDRSVGWETQNILTVAWCITGAALHRTESRGVHFRSDYPTSDDCWCVHSDLRRTQAEIVWSQHSPRTSDPSRSMEAPRSANAPSPPARGRIRGKLPLRGIHRPSGRIGSST